MDAKKRVKVRDFQSRIEIISAVGGEVSLSFAYIISYTYLTDLKNVIFYV